jgi:hypothetical protein
MFWRPKRVHSQGSRAVAHVLVAAVLVASFAMFMVLTAGSAQACPPGKETSGSVSMAHNAKRTVATMSATSALTLTNDVSQGGGRCCGGGAHSHGVCCASGCCSALSLAIDVASSGLVLLDGSIRHVVPRQDGLAATRPPPEFRPPRTFA